MQRKDKRPCPMCNGERTIWNPEGTKKCVCPWCKGSGTEA